MLLNHKFWFKRSGESPRIPKWPWCLCSADNTSNTRSLRVFKQNTKTKHVSQSFSLNSCYFLWSLTSHPASINIFPLLLSLTSHFMTFDIKTNNVKLKVDPSYLFFNEYKMLSIFSFFSKNIFVKMIYLFFVQCKIWYMCLIVKVCDCFSHDLFDVLMAASILKPLWPPALNYLHVLFSLW